MSFDFNQPYPSQRSPVLATNMVVTSQPLAAQAGLRMMQAGGNAVDAALASAIALTVVEPTSNGVGSDLFCMIWDGQELHGLNASGKSPRGWTRERFDGLDHIPEKGWDSVTVPGAVSGWVALGRRFGKLPFAKLFEPAIAYARGGFPVTPVVARNWARGAKECDDQPGFRDAFLPGGRPPAAGEAFFNRPLAATLESIAASEGKAFYEGELAVEMTRHAAEFGGAMTLDDLADHRVEWCRTLAQNFGGNVIHELPPNGQGIAVLIAAGILDRLRIERYSVDDPQAIHLAIEAIKLGFADVETHIGDPLAMKIDPSALLHSAYLDQRAALVDPARAQVFAHGEPKGGGTVYVATGDAGGMMVSLIQSNFEGFGSGVVVPGTGISLQNRGIGFVLQRGHVNEVGPRKRPRHTIMPGFAFRQGQPLMAMGVQGGPMQPQAHLQLAMRCLLYRQNPQIAVDAPRWRFIKERQIAFEHSATEKTISALAEKGHLVQKDGPESTPAYGGAQIICRTGSCFIGGSDPRKDGCAVGY